MDALPVFDDSVDQVLPLSCDLSIMYPVIAAPPLSLGAVHDKSISDDDATVAVSPVGGCGAVATVPDEVVAVAVFDGEPVPTEFIADTRYM